MDAFRRFRYRFLGLGALVFVVLVMATALMPVASAGDPLGSNRPHEPKIDKEALVARRAAGGAVGMLGEPDASGRVTVEIVHASVSTPVALASEVRRVGGVVAGRSPGVTLVRVPPEAATQLARRPDVDYVRAPLRVDLIPEGAEASASPDVAGVHTAATNADAWHSAGYVGAGVKVGIVDGFDGGVWSGAQSAGYVPAPAGTFCRYNGAGCDLWALGGAHGVAVAEVIHDMAPGASLYLATVRSVTDLAAAVEWFDSQGVQIISRSLAAYLDGPGDGTGSLDAVVDDAASHGIAWFNASGNHASASGTSGGTYWRGAFVDADGDGWMEFPTGYEDLLFSCGLVQGFRWSDWQPSGRTDYDIAVWDLYGNLVAFSTDDQAAGYPPIETLGSINCNAYPLLFLGVYLYDPGTGTSGDTLEFMVNGGGGFEYSSNPYSATQPASDSANAGLISVGAIDPADGTTIASYSSQGPTNDGRTKPDLSAPSCLVSYSYAPSCFNGTSAATPVAAGAAALVWGAGVETTPATVVQYLKARAVDLGVPGPDNVYGHGELSLGDSPPPDIVAPALTGMSVDPTIVSNDGTDMVSATVTAADQLSGVSSIVATWFSPSGDSFEISLTDPADRASGTPQSGVWTGTNIIPVSSETGVWILDRVRIADSVGNTAEFLPDDLTGLGVPSPGFTVSSLPPGGTFVDDDGNYHEPMIEAIAAAGITAGCATNPARYCPSNPVKRLEMAVFLVRAAGEADNLPTYQGYFADVPQGVWYAPWVERLYELGITQGCAVEPRRFCPDGTVLRLEMATFIVRYLEGDGSLPAYQGIFTDVPEGQWWTPYVERLFQLDVTKGCSASPARFCPMDLVFRDQMASFLGRAMGLEPIAPPPP